MLQFKKQRHPAGLTAVSNILKEMERKNIRFNLDTLVYKLQLHSIRRETKQVLSTFHKILEKHTPSVEVFNIVLKVSKQTHK